jgi:hypothetical protein
MLVFETGEEETRLDNTHVFGGHVPEVGQYIDWQLTINAYGDAAPVSKGQYRVERVTWLLKENNMVVRIHLVWVYVPCGL